MARILRHSWGLAVLLTVAPSFAQSLPNAVAAPSAEQQFLDRNGKPLVGSKICTYAAGTSTPLATYTSSAAGTPNTNPITLDINGRAAIWIGPPLYKFVLRTGGTAYPASDACTTGTIVFTEDNLTDATLYFVNYVKSIGNATLITYDPPNSQSQVTVAAELTALTSSPYINLKLNCGAKGDGTTDDLAKINACLANNSTVYAPPGTYCVSNTVVIPNKTALFGSGRGDSGGPNTVFKACASFPSNVPVISLCQAPGPCFGVQVTRLSIDCNSKTGCIGGYNGYSEEQSWFQHVLVTNNPGDGFLVNYAAQNSGPYEDIEVDSSTAAIATTTCFHVNVVMGVGLAAWRGILGITCDANGYTVIPTNAIYLEGLSPGSIADVHVEHYTNGVTLGSSTYGASDVFISNISTGPDNANSVLISPAGMASSQNITVISGDNSTASGKVVRDSCNSLVLDATTAGLGFYATGYGACGAQTILTTRSDIPVSFQTSVAVLKNLTVPGTGASDASMCFGLGMPSPFCLKEHDSMTAGVGGPVIKTQNLGMLVQNGQVTEGNEGGGLSLNGNGFNTDPSAGQAGAGMSSDMGTYTARGTTAAFTQWLDGVLNFYADSGLTPGSTYTPTLRWQMPLTGGLTNFTGTVFASLGAPRNGTIIYCSNCANASNPCAASGSGAFAKRLNGAWDCR